MIHFQGIKNNSFESIQLRLIIILLLLSAIFFSGCDRSAINVTGLSCEYLKNPLGIDETKPRLSWQLKSDERGQKQTAFHLIVANSPEKLDENTGDLWDSGKIKTDQSVQVEYKGDSLKTGMNCYWKVRVWDKDGKQSPWSQPAKWSMGLLNPDDWSAKWIGSPDSVTAPYYRRSFNLDNTPDQAFIYLASLGYFEL